MPLVASGLANEYRDSSDSVKFPEPSINSGRANLVLIRTGLYIRYGAPGLFQQRLDDFVLTTGISQLLAFNSG